MGAAGLRLPTGQRHPDRELVRRPERHGAAQAPALPREHGHRRRRAPVDPSTVRAAQACVRLLSGCTRLGRDRRLEPCGTSLLHLGMTLYHSPCTQAPGTRVRRGVRCIVFIGTEIVWDQREREREDERWWFGRWCDG